MAEAAFARKKLSGQVTVQFEMILRRETRLKRGSAVQSRAVDDGAVLIDMRTGICFELNRVGGEIWSILQTPVAVSTICDSLAATYRVTRLKVESDVNQLLMELLRVGLVEAVND